MTSRTRVSSHNPPEHGSGSWNSSLKQCLRLLTWIAKPFMLITLKYKSLLSLKVLKKSLQSALAEWINGIVAKEKNAEEEEEDNDEKERKIVFTYSSGTDAMTFNCVAIFCCLIWGIPRTSMHQIPIYGNHWSSTVVYLKWWKSPHSWSSIADGSPMLLDHQRNKPTSSIG